MKFKNRIKESDKEVMSATMSLDDAVKQCIAQGKQCSSHTVDVLRSHTVLELMKAMQEFLVTPDTKTLNIALYTIGKAVTGRVDVSQEELSLVINFLCEKCNNFSAVDSALDALGDVLVVQDGMKCKLVANVEDDAFGMVIGAFSNVQVQNLVVTTRRVVFKLLEGMVLSRPQLCGSQSFMRSFLNCVDGERDPELVLSSFKLVNAVLVNSPSKSIAFLIEEYFEFISSYFPLMFTPPPGCTVTKPLLAASLHSALALPIFHEYCIPFLTSKITSPSATAKIDSLDCIRHIVLNIGSKDSSSYELPQLEPHVPEILSVLRSEVVKLHQVKDTNPEAVSLMKENLEIITLLVRTCAVTVQSSSSAILSLVDPIVSAAISTVETDSVSGRTYATMMHAICESSVVVCAALLGHVIPLMMQFIEGDTTAKIRRQENCCCFIAAIYAACEKHCASPSTIGQFRDSVVPGSFLSDVQLKLQHILVDSASTTLLVRVSAETLATAIAISNAVPEWCTEPTAVYELLCKQYFGMVDGDDSESVESIRAALANVGRVDQSRLLTVLFGESQNVSNNLSKDRGSGVQIDFAIPHSQNSTKRYLHLVEALSKSLTSPLALIASLSAFAHRCVSDAESMKQTYSLASQLCKLSTVDVKVSSEFFSVMVQNTVTLVLATDHLCSEQLNFVSDSLASMSSADKQEELLKKIEFADIAFAAKEQERALCVSAAVVSGIHTLSLLETLNVDFQSLFDMFVTGCSSTSPSKGSGGGSVVRELCNRGVAGMVTSYQDIKKRTGKNLNFIDKVESISTSTISFFTVGASVAKGLLARSAVDEGDRLLQLLIDAIERCDDGLVDDAIVAFAGILAPPAPSISDLMWEQRTLHIIFSMVEKKLSKPSDEETATSAARLLNVLVAILSVAPARNVSGISVRVVNFVAGSLLSKESSEVDAAILCLVCCSKYAKKKVVTTLCQMETGILDRAVEGASMRLRGGLMDMFTDIAEQLMEGDASQSSSPTGKVIAGDMDALPSRKAVIQKWFSSVMSSATLACNDNKRKVRTAASRCKHTWFKLKD